MRFAKYQALGNDYLVIDATELGRLPAARLAATLCDRHFGVGADGLLVSAERAPDGSFGLRILNPDGSEAEKSGNGLRIHARYLWDRALVADAPFEIRTAGGLVRCRVAEAGRSVSVEMGRVSFRSGEIPVTGPDREVLREVVDLGTRRLEINAASVGNPHCVVFHDDPSPELAREIGPLLERHPLFPNGTNVQLVRVEDRHRIRIEIWERGAGNTLASGTSSCAAAAVCCRLGHCESPVSVRMPGGELGVELSDDDLATLHGPVEQVAEGRLAQELLSRA